MTTTIITDLIGAFCEVYYKTLATQSIADKNSNTIKNFGFNTTNSINFGFEIAYPININSINLQFGVLTNNNGFVFNQSPTLNNNIYFNDLPSSGVSTARYKNKLFPVIINISPNGNNIYAFSTSILSNGHLLNNDQNTKKQLIRNFENSFSEDQNNTILILFEFKDVNLIGYNSGWTVQNTSLYSYDVYNYTINNGFGQFGSFLANNFFVANNQSFVPNDIQNSFQSAYALVYNWKNNLDWNNMFNTWYQNNKYSLNIFLQKFLTDFFGL